MPAGRLMDSLLENKAALAAACACAVALGIFGVVRFERPAAPAPDAPPNRQAGWDGPIGPGALAGAVRELPAAFDAQASGVRIAVDGAGHLVPDLALRRLFESSLGKAGGAERQARVASLRAFLAGSLRAPAAQEADRLLTDYLAYLDTEQQVLARERLARPDPAGLSDAEVRQLLAWLQQRAQLRQRMLGMQVAQAWFAQDDGDCAGTLADWRLQQLPDDSDQLDSNELQDRRRFGTLLAERRNAAAQYCAQQLMEGR